MRDILYLIARRWPAARSSLITAFGSWYFSGAFQQPAPRTSSLMAIGPGHSGTPGFVVEDANRESDREMIVRPTNGERREDLPT